MWVNIFIFSQEPTNLGNEEEHFLRNSIPS